MTIKKGFFVTATDTDAGKTYCCEKLLHAWQQQALSTLAIKPIACGTVATPDGELNEDTYLLHQASSVKLDYPVINPLCFAEPIAPHIAAPRTGVDLRVEHVIAACQPALAQSVDRLLIEGAGGCAVPLNAGEDTGDLIRAFGYPALLIVPIKLGCQNHARLALHYLQQKKIDIAGWIANRIDPNMLYLNENIESLSKEWGAPYCII